MQAYTQQQIARLVKAANNVAAEMNELLNSDLAVGNEDESTEETIKALDELDASLAPFQPEPKTHGGVS